MAIYDFRLEAQDGSGHYRQGATAAASEEEARRTLEVREARAVGYRLTVAELADAEAAEGEAADQDRPAPADIRAKLAAHRQAEPYKLVRLEKRKGT